MTKEDNTPDLKTLIESAEEAERAAVSLSLLIEKLKERGIESITTTNWSSGYRGLKLFTKSVIGVGTAIFEYDQANSDIKKLRDDLSKFQSKESVTKKAKKPTDH